MEVEEYAALDATDLVRLVKDSQVSPAELRDTAIAAIEAVDGALNATVAGPYRGDDLPEPDVENAPLAGVPFAVKDTLTEAGRPFRFGTALLEGFTARVDATLAARFKQAGLQSVVRRRSRCRSHTRRTVSPSA